PPGDAAPVGEPNVRRGLGAADTLDDQRRIPHGADQQVEVAARMVGDDQEGAVVAGDGVLIDFGDAAELMRVPAPLAKEVHYGAGDWLAVIVEDAPGDGGVLVDLRRLRLQLNLQQLGSIRGNLVEKLGLVIRRPDGD